MARPDLIHQLGQLAWPSSERFPVNQGGSRVRHTVWADLVLSDQPLIVAGYSSIGELIDFLADWAASPNATAGSARILLGAEPFSSERVRFGDARVVFTEEVAAYWLEERGISVLLSARILTVLELLSAGRVEVRFLHGVTPLHAKIYVGDTSATVGSSNFTGAGLSYQFEANARFDEAADPDRHRELVQVASNYWDAGTLWTDGFIALLESMLQVVGWREALARACAELLEGEWAYKYLGDLTTADGSKLWPSQVVGIAQALWVVDRVGSVLVADATGSGKTKMGAHLVRAIRDRLWNTGRVRTDLTVLVCPPAVQESWDDEALRCGLSLRTVSHGRLSRRGDGHRRSTEEQLVSGAQILAVDEAHHYLNPTSHRTQQVRASQADHVALFTATPINRGQSDLLQLVALLGPDNFNDDAIAVLQELQRRRRRPFQTSLLESDIELLRREIQQFTVRRTKSMLNEFVGRSPEDFRHPVTGRICRYPDHEPLIYDTGETSRDAGLAEQIHEVVAELIGLSGLENRIAVPERLRREYSDPAWLEFRLGSIGGLAAHHVLSAIRSSAAAAMEHLVGTERSVEQYGLELRPYKQASTGDVIGKLRQRAEDGPPVIDLACEVPEWLLDAKEWRSACHEEADRYERIASLVLQLSDARETAKADVIRDAARRHRLVLAFDRHPITLAVIAQHLGNWDRDVVIATSTGKTRKRVERLFGRDSVASAVGLCSDALNEGLNLQGASAVVHLDLPTTMRVAEQRIGRVDRMDSPHDRIEVWWPNDGPAFATRANEHLARRAADSDELLGSNMPVPREILGKGARVDVRDEIADAERARLSEWDGIGDVLDPVRQLVEGDGSLVDRRTYEHHRGASNRVLARVSPLSSDRPWLFVAVGGTSRGAPRWMYLDDELDAPLCELDSVADALRSQLVADPPERALDDGAVAVLERLLERAQRHEELLLPRRHQRALVQMRRITTAWAEAANLASDFPNRERWLAIKALANGTSSSGQVDLHQVAERWLRIVAPMLESHRRSSRQPFALLKQIEPALLQDPISLDEVEQQLSGLTSLRPLGDRVSACIIGVPPA